jgi:lysozyme
MKKFISAIKMIALSILFFIFISSCSHNGQGGHEAVQNETLFGIDVSHYQGNVCWQTVATQNRHAPVEFAIIRSTMGADRKDKKFEKNLSEARKHGLMVGAYHYYDPNENSLKQADNYLRTIKGKIKKGDFVPILDIEQKSRVQSMAKLKIGLKKWLDAVEREYEVKPIIYTGYAYYRDHLKDDQRFAEYPIWIAAYSSARRDDPIVAAAAIHQFAEHVRMPGIPQNTVDGNDIKRRDLPMLVLK